MEHSLERQFELTQLKDRISKLSTIEEAKIVAISLLELNFRLKTTTEAMAIQGWLVK